MKLTLRAMSALLSYPSAELKQHIGEVRQALYAEAALPPEALARLEPLLRSFETEELLELQAAYSELFDRSRSLSLHIFEHVHGESRERGQAMIDLGQHYIDSGFIMQAPELPDFLPIFLEFLSCAPPAQAREWLSEPAHVLAALEQRLGERKSPYAAVFHALVALPGAKPDPTAVAELQARVAGEGAKTLDEEWEDAPVNFGAPIQNGGGPTGVIAKIRAARRAVASAGKG
jgi:nitrate reductase delta subunit